MLEVAGKTVRRSRVGPETNRNASIVELLHVRERRLVLLAHRRETGVRARILDEGFSRQQGAPRPDGYARGEYDYRRMLERDDLDIVLIATPWGWHTPMAVDAMKAGKHAFIEVLAAVTVEECWELVEAQESTGRHCIMMENVCYGREELMVLNMCRQGVFGELTHGEGSYIHDLREQMKDMERGTGVWRTPHHTKRNGNLYPTHGLGPIAQ